MEILRKLRWVLYPSIFILIFIIGSYCSFPSAVLRQAAKSSLTYAAAGLVAPSRGFAKVSIKDVSLWHLSGVDLQGVELSWPGTKKEAPLAINIARLKARMGILAKLAGTNKYTSEMALYDGSLSADIKFSKQKNLLNLDLNASKIDLGKADFIQSIIGTPLSGILNLIVDLNANSELSKDGTGTINLSLDQGSFGPGMLKLPPPAMIPSLNIPQISFGALKARFTLDKGQLESNTITFQGGDFEAEIQVSITLGRIPALSRLAGKGWFSLKKEFINSNETIKMLFDLIPELRAAKSGDGKVGFILGGTLGRPMPRLQAGVDMQKSPPSTPPTDTPQNMPPAPPNPKP